MSCKSASKLLRPPGPGYTTKLQNADVYIRLGDRFRISSFLYNFVVVLYVTHSVQKIN